MGASGGSRQSRSLLKKHRAEKEETCDAGSEPLSQGSTTWCPRCKHGSTYLRFLVPKPYPEWFRGPEALIIGYFDPPGKADKDHSQVYLPCVSVRLGKVLSGNSGPCDGKLAPCEPCSRLLVAALYRGDMGSSLEDCCRLSARTFDHGSWSLTPAGLLCATGWERARVCLQQLPSHVFHTADTEGLAGWSFRKSVTHVKYCQYN